MLMRVVQKPSSAPTSDAEEEIVWSSTYGEEQLDDADGLSGSILSSVLPGFEVGTWYALEEFNQKLGAVATDEASSWTILGVHLQGYNRNRHCRNAGSAGICGFDDLQGCC
jgi:hypothetical protein